ncbi:hypothetical protein C8034_v004604 [Colletotrichum sidae]|uniref:Uncharacterized protein n=1 Tax=Colletotrichum sidae TaxID=1347389 RepID=A0A4R8TSL9_9PEZI|nr:hypothetical protein C8034_v004604 [Colletotrichum sidae]
MTLSMPRGPKAIEAICPGCFKSFTKIGSMHRHIYEDRCRNPDRQFVQKIKAEHSARVSAAAARSAARSARAAARAAPSASAPASSGPPRQSAANKTPNAANTKPVRAGEGGGQQARATLVHCDCGLAFAGENALQFVSGRGTFQNFVWLPWGYY